MIIDNKNEIMRAVGAYCRQWREAQGLTQRELAHDTSFYKETYSGFENGRNNNAYILLRYITLGADVEKIKEIYNNGFTDYFKP